MATEPSYGRYAISMDEPRRIAEIWLSGEMTVEDHVRARYELLQMCRAHGVRRILVDAAQLAGRPTTGELFDFAADWPALLRQSAVVVAGVLPQNPATRRWWLVKLRCKPGESLFRH